MTIIIDSGSTKSSWSLLFDNQLFTNLKTDGINPIFLSEEEIKKIIISIFPVDKGIVKKIHFYGAGCGNFEAKKRVFDAFKACFPNAEIEVESDLMAAARALCGRETGVACILGTGSNSCLFDGEKIIQQTPPLGFILGDEGSGAALGCLLVSDFLKRQMPEQIAEIFKEKYNFSQEEIIQTVYQKPLPSRFLASFAPFFKENLHQTYCYNRVFDEFCNFFERNLLNYNNIYERKINFVGSIAFHFADVLEVALQEYGLQLGTILAAPQEGLLKFHFEN